MLVAGLPASGKSTLAAALAKELGFPMFSKDSMKELLYDSVGFQCRAEKVALGVGAMDILYYCAGQ
ncbi:MAG: AAA family ATPase, partial [Acutalibacter sp.]|nr:AAA family ATPase [Acutalibacter sp.]